MRSLAALLLLLPLVAPAQPVAVPVHREQVQVAPGETPREFTVACPAGEQVLSGGFAGVPPDVRVIASLPGDDRWSVTVVNQSQVERSYEINVVCAAVATQVVSAAGTSVDCPPGTVVTGGGHSPALVTGSHPRTGGWAVDLFPASQVPALEVRAVCASGVEALPAEPVILEPPGGSASCAGTLVGGGYQVTGGRPPLYSIATAAVSEAGQWRVDVIRRSPDDTSLAVRAVPICVAFPSPSPTGAGPVPERDEILPIVAGACLLAGLFLALVLVMVARVRGRSRRPAPQGQVTVVLGERRGAFRLDRMREVP